MLKELYISFLIEKKKTTNGKVKVTLQKEVWQTPAQPGDQG